MGKSINVGIDLGTTNTLVCIEIKGKPKCLKFKSESSQLLPSVFYYENGEVKIGSDASQKGVLNPDNIVRSSKTFMGSSKTWNIDGRIFTPTDIATEILKEVKNTILMNIKRFGFDENTVIDAIITVPAYFSLSQIEETKKAGQRAGLNVKGIKTEPMAAAVAYITDIGSENSAEKLLVMDLGGGTFDLSLLQYNPTSDNYETMYLDGDSNLGGDDFDNLLVEELKGYIFDEIGLDLTDEKTSKLSGTEYRIICGKLRTASEQAKIRLSNSEQVTITIPNLCTYKNKDYDFNIEFTRDEFNEVCQPLYDKIFNRLNLFIKQNNIHDVWKVALVGGSCNIPYIREQANKMFPNKVFSDLDLSTLVVTGAYLISASMTGVGVENKYSDILSHSLGIELLGGKFSTLLNRFDKYPCKYTHTFSTATDYQERVNIKVFETKDLDNEDKSLTKNCNFYGSFVLDNIERAKKGVPKIDVTFEFDDSRILTVTAIDKKTNAKKKIVIQTKEAIQNVQQETVPMDIFLLLDCSFSMELYNKMKEAKEASYKLINEMIDFKYHKMGIISFGSYCNLLCELTNDNKLLTNKVKSITPNGDTDLTSAINLAISNFNYKNKRDKYIIIVTDGRPNDSISARAVALKAIDENIHIITIGVGLNDTAKTLLFDISSKKKDGTKFTYNIQNMSNLTEIFEEIVGELTLA